jgi:uncharacterized protein YaiI (UPF0178 family)
MVNIYIDIANCPTYRQILHTAQEQEIELYVVTRDYMESDPHTHLILAQEDERAARQWIAANISRGDICVTTDVTLASGCLLREALALMPNGRPWTTVLVNAVAVVRSDGCDGREKPKVGWNGDSRTFARRLAIAIAEARATRGRSNHRGSGFDRFGIQSAVRSLPWLPGAVS